VNPGPYCGVAALHFGLIQSHTPWAAAGVLTTVNLKLLYRSKALHLRTLPLDLFKNFGNSDMKPIIRKLYLDQGQTLEQLAKYLEDNHGYKPT